MGITDHVEDLTTKILHKITDGRRHIVLWGFNPHCVRLLTELHGLGIAGHVSAIVDPDPAKIGARCFDLEVRAAAELSTIQMDVLAITEDLEKEKALKCFIAVDSRTPDILIAGSKHYEFRDQEFAGLVKACPIRSKAGGYPDMLIHIYQSIKYIARRKLAGSVAEFGCFQAGTTVFIAKAFEAMGVVAHIYAFDTFAGYPERKSALDLFRNPKYEFRDKGLIQSYCKNFPIEFIQGDICETYKRLNHVPLVFSFFDTDNYSATKAAVGLCLQQTVPGGILAFDHYFSPDWIDTIGERMAVNECMTELNTLNLHGTGIFIKI